MPSVFLTGFPGFLGSQLVERLLDRLPSDVAVNCLIQGAYGVAAESRKRAIGAQRDGWAERICLYEGDITAPDLGLGDLYGSLAADTREIYHLAAAYALGVNRDLALRVNVAGTRNMLAFAHASLPQLTRFQYMSTCFVSGSHRGEFTERDLAKGQSFNNHYEETKYLAEMDVQDQMDKGLPCAIYRPAIVVGDSHTGETQKYDGPYYLMQWMLRMRGAAVIPILGNPKDYLFNIVPRDFVVAAVAYLSGIEASAGKVYQLCDPAPPTVDGLIDIMARATGARAIRLPSYEPATRRLLQLGPMRRWTGLEPAAVHYFEHPTVYTCDDTLADLQGSGIVCPPFASYVENLVRFMREHPEIPTNGMV